MLSPSKKIIQNIGIALIIIVLNFAVFEGIARILYCLHPPMASYNDNFDLKYHLAEKRPDEKTSILFFGDSLTERAVYPEYLQMLLRKQGLKTDIVNLATGAATPPISFEMLKHMVDKENKPSLAVMNITWRSFHKYWQTELFRGENPNDAMAASYLGQCRFNHPRGLTKLSCEAKKQFIVLRYPQLLSDVAHQLPDYLMHTKHKMWSIRDEANTLFFKRGWVPHQSEFKTPDEFNKYLQSKKNAFYRYEAFFPSIAKQGWYTESYMAEITRYCRENKIPLVLVLLPEIDTFSHNFYSRSLHISKPDFLKRVRQFAAHSGASFWDLSDTIPDSLQYADTSHLNLFGAIHYNQLLAKKLFTSRKYYAYD